MLATSRAPALILTGHHRTHSGGNLSLRRRRAPARDVLCCIAGALGGSGLRDSEPERCRSRSRTRPRSARVSGGDHHHRARDHELPRSGVLLLIASQPSVSERSAKRAGPLVRSRSRSSHCMDSCTPAGNKSCHRPDAGRSPAFTVERRERGDGCSPPATPRCAQSGGEGRRPRSQNSRSPSFPKTAARPRSTGLRSPIPLRPAGPWVVLVPGLFCTDNFWSTSFPSWPAAIAWWCGILRLGCRDPAGPRLPRPQPAHRTTSRGEPGARLRAVLDAEASSGPL